MPNVRELIWWILGLLTGFILGLVIGAVTRAEAQTAELQPMTVTIPIDDIQRGDPGELFLVATAKLPDGIDCAGTLKTNNNRSQHPDTNIIMVSATTATIFDVEVASYESRSLALRSGVFESDGMVDVFVQVGPHGVSSTGFDLIIDCGGTTTTTTEPPTVTTTTTPPPGGTTTTTGPPSSTTSSTIPTGIPSGVGPVGGGLSPGVTWALLAGLFALVGFLGWALIHGGRKIDNG